MFIWGVSTNGEHWSQVDAANNIGRIASNIFESARIESNRNGTTMQELLEFLSENNISGDMWYFFSSAEPFTVAFAYYFPGIPKSATQALAYASEGMRCFRAQDVDRGWALLSAANFLMGRALSSFTDDQIVKKDVIDEAKRRAHLRHSENHAAKVKVFNWCDENMSYFDSMDDAAVDIAGTFIPQKFRTVRAWMTEWKKLRAASRP
jgi:hypothetical protein